jgi:uncharacterized sodium:solute symporter family permease YidK
MSTTVSDAKRNEWVNFIPILTLACALFVLEGLGLDIPGRILIGVHIVAFYWISIRMVFKKHFSRLVILLVVFPATAVFTYVIMLFLHPRRPQDQA